MSYTFFVTCDATFPNGDKLLYSNERFTEIFYKDSHRIIVIWFLWRILWSI